LLDALARDPEQRMGRAWRPKRQAHRKQKPQVARHVLEALQLKVDRRRVRVQARESIHGQET
jgi:hypothetical protein